MKAVAKVLTKIIVAGFIGLCIESCLLGDPWVELGNGYNIGAICWNCPCQLVYWERRDPRPRSQWVASRVHDSFLIFHSTSGEEFTYETEAAWRAAIAEKSARPSAGGTLPDGVSGFNNGERFCIGSGTGGYFLLDKHNDTVESWKTREEWATAVRTRTPLDPAVLHDPKAWQHQYRSRGYWLVMGPYLALVLLWICLSLVPRLRRFDFELTRRGGW